MRKLLTLSVLTAAALAGQSRTVLDNARVRVFREDNVDARSGADRDGPFVKVDIKTGEVWWGGDAQSLSKHGPVSPMTTLVTVEVKPVTTSTAPPKNATAPGGGAFTGMSFKPIFENDKVSVIRARMEVGAREAFHTHASDTVVVHLSGGEIEDTADGKTVVNKWKPGDVEYEAGGSSHSARNVGGPVDVVLVVLK
jgi:quercetin dioxygenase-like cupin family protein